MGMMMSEWMTFLIALAALGLAGWSQWQYRQQVKELLREERFRTKDWWFRTQAHVDNLQDRVMSKEWEVYAQATLVERPSDQPVYDVSGDLAGEQMAESLLDVLRRQQTAEPYDGAVDLAEDYLPGPTVG